VLKEFYNLTRETAIFLEVKQYDTNDVKYTKWQWDVSYLVGITNHLLEFNAEQQGIENWVISWSENTNVFQINFRIYETPIKTTNLVDSEISSRWICVSEVEDYYSNATRKTVDYWEPKLEIELNFKHCGIHIWWWQLRFESVLQQNLGDTGVPIFIHITGFPNVFSFLVK